MPASSASRHLLIVDGNLRFPGGNCPRSRERSVVTGDLAGMLEGLRAFAIPMPVKFRGITVREGALVEGPAGWGEFSPFAEYGPKESARWLASAIESATREWP